VNFLLGTQSTHVGAAGLRSVHGGNGKAIEPIPFNQAQMLLSHVGQFSQIFPSHFYPQAPFYKGMVTVPFNVP
jgi:hypothetical protein